ncbi:MAG: DinB family protein [Bacteroidota bacterium]
MIFFQTFIEQSIHHMDLNLPRIKNCLERISEEELWKAPNDSSNSIGNLILHLCGNIRQYIQSGIGRQPDTRQRSKEFSARDTYDKESLYLLIEEVVQGAFRVLRAAAELDLLRVRSVQGFQMTGVAIVIHVVEHFSYHTGQIALLTKIMRDEDLGFYGDMDLDVLND